MMHGDRLDVARALIKRVNKADVAMAAQSEGIRHLLPDQIIDDDLTAIQHVTHRLLPPMRDMRHAEDIMRPPPFGSGRTASLFFDRRPGYLIVAVASFAIRVMSALAS